MPFNVWPYPEDPAHPYMNPALSVCLLLCRPSAKSAATERVHWRHLLGSVVT